MNLDKTPDERPVRDEDASGELGSVALMFVLGLLVLLFVFISHAPRDDSPGVATVKSEASIARQAFSQGNYVTYLDEKKLQASSQVSPDANLLSCQESGAICLLNSIAFPETPVSDHLRKTYLADIPQEYLMAPHTYGHAVSCRSSIYDDKNTVYSTFLVAGSHVRGDVVKQLRQYVALIHRQTGAAPVVHGADSEITHRFYALSGSNLPSIEGLIYRFSLNNGFVWVAGIGRNGEGEVVTVFEPFRANATEKLPGEKPLCL